MQISDEARSRPREKVRASLKATLDRANRRLESHANLDAIVVVAEPWTAENGLLTPTLKIKRHVLEERFGELVQGIRGGQVRWEDEI